MSGISRTRHHGGRIRWAGGWPGPTHNVLISHLWTICKLGITSPFDIIPVLRSMIVIVATSKIQLQHCTSIWCSNTWSNHYIRTLQPRFPVVNMAGSTYSKNTWHEHDASFNMTKYCSMTKHCSVTAVLFMCFFYWVTHRKSLIQVYNSPWS